MSLDIVSLIMICLLAFKDSWQRINDSRGASGAIVLKGLYDLAKFMTDIALAQGLIQQYKLDVTNQRLAYARRDVLRALLYDKITRFHHLVRYQLDETDRHRLPKIPNAKAKQQEFLDICEAYRNLWEYLMAQAPNGLPDPLTIEGYTLVLFTADLAALRTAYETASKSKLDALLSRQARDHLVYKVIKPRLIEFRSRVKAALDKNDLLLINLPTISSKKGPRPDAVGLAGSWDADSEKGMLTWTPSVRPDLLHYEVRACLATYRTDDEFQIATVAKDQLSLQTSEGLGSEGSTMYYKVYVVTTAGRERGSNAVKVVRTADLPVSV